MADSVERIKALIDKVNEAISKIDQLKAKTASIGSPQAFGFNSKSPFVQSSNKSFKQQFSNYSAASDVNFNSKSPNPMPNSKVPDAYKSVLFSTSGISEIKGGTPNQYSSIRNSPFSISRPLPTTIVNASDSYLNKFKKVLFGDDENNKPRQLAGAGAVLAALSETAKVYEAYTIRSGNSALYGGQRAIGGNWANATRDAIDNIPVVGAISTAWQHVLSGINNLFGNTLFQTQFEYDPANQQQRKNEYEKNLITGNAMKQIGNPYAQISGKYQTDVLTILQASQQAMSKAKTSNERADITALTESQLEIAKGQYNQSLYATQTPVQIGAGMGNIALTSGTGGDAVHNIEGYLKQFATSGIKVNFNP